MWVLNTWELANFAEATLNVMSQSQTRPSFGRVRRRWRAVVVVTAKRITQNDHAMFSATILFLTMAYAFEYFTLFELGLFGVDMELFSDLVHDFVLRRSYSTLNEIRLSKAATRTFPLNIKTPRRSRNVCFLSKLAAMRQC